MIEGAFELQAAAAHVLEGSAEQAQGNLGIDEGSALPFFLIVRQDLPRQDETLRLLPGFRQPPLDQEAI
jgi:hypothetical protein